MPLPAHFRVTFRGHFWGPTGPLEDFSYGLNFARYEGDFGSAAQKSLDACVAAATAFHSDAGIGWSESVRITEVKVAAVGTDGKYNGDPLIAATDIRGGNPQAMRYPPQVALVVSLGSARRGATGKGRCFLPAPNAALGADLTVGGEAAQVAAGFVTLLQTIRDTGAPVEPGSTGKLTPVIVSSKGYVSPVTQVRVGRVLDTMRSRRRALLENYGAPSPV